MDAEPGGTASSSSAGAAPWTSASDDDGRALKRGRRSRPKVKTGCNNCKQRRIKCDEARPTCTQCLRSNKVCSGYPPPPRSSRPHEEIRIAPKPLMAAAPMAAAPDLAPAGGLAGRDVGGFIGRGIALSPPQASRRAQQPTPKAPSSSSSPSQQQHAREFSGESFMHQPSFDMSLDVPLDETVAPYFDVFRNQAAAELSGYFDSIFWTHMVLQECISEPAIRHAAVALGALYRHLEQIQLPFVSTPTHDPSLLAGSVEHWQVAIQQYSEACNHMMLLDGQSQRSHRTRLMASVLLTCFDSFIGDHKQAVVQIQSGLGLFDRLQAESGWSQRTLAAHDPVEEELIVIFTRLAVQAKSYDLAFHFAEPYVIRLSQHGNSQSSTPSSNGPLSSLSLTPPPPPQPFSSIREARLASDQVHKTVLRCLEGLLSNLTEGTHTALPEAWTRQITDFKLQLDTWSAAFEPLLASRKTPGLTAKQRAGISVLKMGHTSSQILLPMLFSKEETAYDDFMLEFKLIVDLGIDIVSEDESRAVVDICSEPGACQHQCDMSPNSMAAGIYSANHIKPTFSADLGIVPALYVVATKCREPVLRRQAIQLLRSCRRREGMWDSELVARIAHWLMELEETDVDGPYRDLSLGAGANPERYGFDGDTGGASDEWAQSRKALALTTVPPERRVMIKGADFDLRARIADLQVGTRGVPPGAPDSRLQLTQITW